MKIAVLLKSDRGKGYFRQRLMYSDGRIWLISSYN